MSSEYRVEPQGVGAAGTGSLDMQQSSGCRRARRVVKFTRRSSTSTWVRGAPRMPRTRRRAEHTRLVLSAIQFLHSASSVRRRRSMHRSMAWFGRILCGAYAAGASPTLVDMGGGVGFCLL
jgi:hypothetical protein